MKPLFTLLFITLFTTITFAQENNFNITISIKGMENQDGLLANYYGDKKYLKDTLHFNEKGVAQIKGNKNIPAGVYLMAFPSMRYASFDFIIKETAFSIQTDTSNFIKHAVIKNSVENKQLFERNSIG